MAKIFKDGKKPVNISNDILEKVEADAEKKQLLPSQVINEILRDYYEKEN